MAKAFGVKLIGNDIYENAYCAVEAIKKLVLLCELPTTLREVGANEELLEQVAKDSLLSVQLRFNCRKACEEQIRTIVREAF